MPISSIITDGFGPYGSISDVILDGFSSTGVTPYPLSIVISESNEYGISIEITLSTSHPLYPNDVLYPSDTLYPTEGIIISGDIVESTEYNITITQSGGS